MEGEQYSITIIVDDKFSRFFKFVGSVIPKVLLVLCSIGLIFILYHFPNSKIDQFNHTIVNTTVLNNSSQNYHFDPTSTITTSKPNVTTPSDEFWDPI